MITQCEDPGFHPMKEKTGREREREREGRMEETGREGVTVVKLDLRTSFQVTVHCT